MLQKNHVRQPLQQVLFMKGRVARLLRSSRELRQWKWKGMTPVEHEPEISCIAWAMENMMGGVSESTDGRSNQWLKSRES